ncbi:DM13 domain-containing protein [Heyndrickxia acidicola]|uniref:DM13 domain-containing protein n=1 Tax=Heyndrickxia acidicola TaxID=209389 RepID=A0ABU6MHK6_9BACI|nr:DM13 domain-containing protein [Heyndrickxia acidicola]MED1203496.1 DM13 domain-containing protein [Heyndrickxia acidicola]
MNKKLGAIFLMLTMILILAACGNGQMKSKSAQSSASSLMTSKMKNSSMDSSMSTSENGSMATLTGNFSGENGKMVSGMVKVSDDKLMLTHFKTSEGPDLHVYLTKDGDVTTGISISKIDLKNPEQTFSLNGVNPKEYNTVVIYCNKAHVAFGAAKLMDVSMDVSGQFKGDNQKNVSGTATVTNTTLKLSNFKTSEGPDLHVYLTKDGDATTGKSISKIDLKNPEQTFSLNGVNPKEYNTVIIYCNKAHVVFGEAKLM